jgi:hypothetical protein
LVVNTNDYNINFLKTILSSGNFLKKIQNHSFVRPLGIPFLSLVDNSHNCICKVFRQNLTTIHSLWNWGLTCWQWPFSSLYVSQQIQPILWINSQLNTVQFW